MSQLLPYLLILICPLTMGLLMWVMMRGMNRDKQADPRVAELESQLAELRSAVSRSRQPEPARSANDGSTGETV